MSKSRLLQKRMLPLRKKLRMIKKMKKPRKMNEFYVFIRSFLIFLLILKTLRSNQIFHDHVVLIMLITYRKKYDLFLLEKDDQKSL